LIYLKVVIKETLRLHPIAPVLVPRESREKCQLERFVDSLIDIEGTDFEFISFGAVRRMCTDIAFVLPKIELPLAMLLYHFD
jgi:cytochrome P450